MLSATIGMLYAVEFATVLSFAVILHEGPKNNPGKVERPAYVNTNTNTIVVSEKFKWRSKDLIEVPQT